MTTTYKSEAELAGEAYATFSQQVLDKLYAGLDAAVQRNALESGDYDAYAKGFDNQWKRECEMRKEAALAQAGEIQVDILN